MSTKNAAKLYDDDMDQLRRGPWTLEEDTLLIHYIACHGEGRWNHLARCSGLKRTGKSCRLRWLNYLKPDVKRGNLTPEEQILILELHSKWGNRWSRIAQHLPGRTDNEIKNYWRTRVQKQARQLKIDANSDVFRDAVRCFWMPRLLERLAAASSSPSPPSAGDRNPNFADPLARAPNGGSQPIPPPPDPFSQGGLLQTPFNGSAPWLQENCSRRVSPDAAAAAGQQAADPSQAAPLDALGNLLLLLQYNDDAFLGDDCPYHPRDGAPNMVAPTPPFASAAAVGSSASDQPPLAICGADNTLDSLWSIDELWQARKLEHWGI